MVPDLTRGLWLEDRNVGLLWRASPSDLNAASPPDFSTIQEGRTVFVWNDRVWRGMQCQMTTSFGGNWRPQSVLLGIKITFVIPKEIRRCSDAFQWLQEKLVELFGKPASMRDDGEDGKAIWQIDGMTLRHEYFDGMGGGHYVVLFLQD